MQLSDILAIAMRGGASAVRLRAGLPPLFRVDGVLVPLKDGAHVLAAAVTPLVLQVMTEDQHHEFERAGVLGVRLETPARGLIRLLVERKGPEDIELTLMTLS
jgi:twitching motility protein PilT